MENSIFAPLCRLIKHENGENLSFNVTTAIFRPENTVLIDSGFNHEELVYTIDFYSSDLGAPEPIPVTHSMESLTFEPVNNPVADDDAITVVINYYDSVYVSGQNPPPTTTAKKKSKIRLADAEIGGDSLS